MTTPERRRTDSIEALLILVQQIHEKQTQIENKIEKHMVDETGELAEAIAKLMKSAFPEGDTDGHRRAHELAIKQAEARAEFWATMQKEIAKWGLIGFLAWATYYLWKAVLLGPK